MVEILWELPVAPTSLFHDVEFAVLTGRQCKLTFSFEGKDDEHMASVSLVFEGVEAFKCTYLSSCNRTMANQAYGMLVDLGNTPWLSEALPFYQKFRRAYGRDLERLRHLMIYFDDGPCYEFLCIGFTCSSTRESYPTN